MDREIEIQNTTPDMVLIGAGIMSVTLGALLKFINPSIKIEIFERLNYVAGESTDAWNNAGTGHSALCELNYTIQREDGSIDCEKALKTMESFEISKQFWAFLVKSKIISNPKSFIKSIPHISFVWGEENIAFLKNRHRALTEYYAFQKMEYTEDFDILKSWMPLVMEGRDYSQKVAGTKMDIGTDVNFGAITKGLFTYLDGLEGINIHLNHEVDSLKKEGNCWELEIVDKNTEIRKKVNSKFVFIGAGGGSLSLLEKSDIPEGKGFGGFPVGGQWLKCNNPEIISKHHAKVYGKASVGAPPMSVPHLDARMIDGKPALLFGPYAGFSTKFLKNGSYLDLPSSINLKNIMPMISAGLDNIPLTKYLIKELSKSVDDKVTALKEFYPNAISEDWEIEIAGQRVQVIKKDKKKGGVLEFGTEVVSAADGSLAALLGASPGASTSVSIMLEVLEKCFPENYNSKEWKEKLKEIIPSHGYDLINNKEMCDSIRNMTSAILEL
jgi:malate dehydrogenase (quinone)